MVEWSPTLCWNYNNIVCKYIECCHNEVSLTNIGDYNLDIGDYLMIDDEIVRVKSSLSNPATNPLQFSVQFWNKSRQLIVLVLLFVVYSNHIQLNLEDTLSTVLLDIHLNMLDMEPGNYSTALPQRQDRDITDREEFYHKHLNKKVELTTSLV